MVIDESLAQTYGTALVGPLWEGTCETAPVALQLTPVAAWL